MSKTVFLNLDFMPPSAEQLFLLPESAENAGIDTITLKMIDNFPWEFDCRMKSDSSYPDSVVEYFIRKCNECGVGVAYCFPDIFSFSRILRLPNYGRMGVDYGSFRIINPEAVGFKSLMESIVDDIVSLIPDIKMFLLKDPLSGEQGGGDAAELYNSVVFGCISDAGYNADLIEHDIEFFYADKIIGTQKKPGAMELFADLNRELGYYHRAFFSLKEFCVMNTLSSNSPTSTETNLYKLVCDFNHYHNRVDEKLNSFAAEAAKLIEPAWLELYLKAVKLTIEGDASDTSNRLRQQGFLN